MWITYRIQSVISGLESLKTKIATMQPPAGLFSRKQRKRHFRELDQQFQVIDKAIALLEKHEVAMIVLEHRIMLALNESPVNSPVTRTARRKVLELLEFPTRYITTTQNQKE